MVSANPLGGQLRGAGVSDEVIDVVLRFDDRFSHGWRRATSYIDPGLRNIERQLGRMDGVYRNLAVDAQGVSFAQREMARTAQYTARTLAHTEASFMDFSRRTTRHVDHIQSLARTTANRDVRRLEGMAREIGGFLTHGGQQGGRLRLEQGIQGRGAGLGELIDNLQHVASSRDVKRFDTERAKLSATARSFQDQGMVRQPEVRPFIFNEQGQIGQALRKAEQAVEANRVLESKIQNLRRAPEGALRLSRPGPVTDRPQLSPAMETTRRRELGETQVPFGRLSPQEQGAYTKQPRRYVVIDTETTGVTPGQDQIFQLSAQQFEDGRPVARQKGGPLTGVNKFLKVDRPIPAQFSRGGKINQELLSSRGMDFAQLRPMLDEVIGDRPVVMQNALFDAFQMLEQSHDYKIKTPIYDTLTTGREMFPGERMGLDVLRQPGHRLGERTPGYQEQYGAPREVFGGVDRSRRLAHEARSDMLDTADLFEFLRAESEVQGKPTRPFTVPGLREPIDYDAGAVTAARTSGIDIRQVVGSGDSGRVLLEDVQQAIAQRPVPTTISPTAPLVPPSGAVSPQQIEEAAKKIVDNPEMRELLEMQRRTQSSRYVGKEILSDEQLVSNLTKSYSGSPVSSGESSSVYRLAMQRALLGVGRGAKVYDKPTPFREGVFDDPTRPSYRGDPQPGHVDPGQTVRDVYAPRGPYVSTRDDAANLAQTYDLMEQVTEGQDALWGQRTPGARPKWDLGPNVPLPEQFESRAFVGPEAPVLPEENAQAIGRWQQQSDALGRYFTGLRREDTAFQNAQNQVRQLDQMAERGSMVSDPEVLQEQLSDLQQYRSVMQERHYGPSRLMSSYYEMGRMGGVEGVDPTQFRRMDVIARKVVQDQVIQDQLTWPRGELSGGPLIDESIQPAPSGLSERDRQAGLSRFWTEYYGEAPEGAAPPAGIGDKDLQGLSQRGPDWLSDLNARYEQRMTRFGTPLEKNLRFMGGDVGAPETRAISPSELAEAMITRHKLFAETGQVDTGISSITEELENIRSGRGSTFDSMSQAALQAESVYRTEASASQGRRVELESMLGLHDENRLFVENIMGRSGLGHVFEEAESNVRSAEMALTDFESSGEIHSFKRAELQSNLRMAQGQLNEAREVLLPQALYDLNQRSIQTGRVDAGQRVGAVGGQMDDAILNLQNTAQMGTVQYRQALENIIEAKQGESLTRARAPQLKQTAADAAMVESMIARRDVSMGGLDRSLTSPEARDTMISFDSAARRLQQLEADRPHALPDDVQAIDQGIAEARTERDAAFASMQGGVGGLRMGEVSGGYNQMNQAWTQVLGDLRSFQDVSLKRDLTEAKLSKVEQEIESAPGTKHQLEDELQRRKAVETLYDEKGARSGDLVGGAEATSRRTQAEGRLRDFEHRMTSDLPLKERELRQGLIWSEQDVTGKRAQFQQSLMVPEDLETFLTENRHLMRDETVTAVEEARLKVQQTGTKFEGEAGKMLEMRGKRGLVEDWELPLFNQRFAEMFQVEGLPEATKVGELRTRQVDLRHMMERFKLLDERIGTLGAIEAPDDAQAAELSQLKRQRQTLVDDGFSPRRARDLHDQLEDKVRAFQTEDIGAPDQKARRKRGRRELFEVYEARVSDMDIAELETKQNQLMGQRNDILKEATQRESDLRAVRDPAKARQYTQEITDLNKQEQDIGHVVSANEVEIGEARRANMDINEKAAEAARLGAEDEAYRHQARKRRLGWDGRAATRLTQTLTGLVGLTVLLAGVTMGLQMGIQTLVEWYMKLREKNRAAASAIRQTSTAMSLQNFETNKAIEYSQTLNTQMDREMRIRLGMATPRTKRGAALATDDRKVEAVRFRASAANIFADTRGGVDEETRGQIDSMVLDWQAQNWQAFRQYMEPGGLLHGVVEPDWLGKVETEYMTTDDRWDILDEMVEDLNTRMSIDFGKEETEKLADAIEDIILKSYEKQAKDWQDTFSKPWVMGVVTSATGGLPLDMNTEKLTDIMINRDTRKAEAINKVLTKVLKGEEPVYSVADALEKFDYKELLGSKYQNEDILALSNFVADFHKSMQANRIDPQSKLDPNFGLAMLTEQRTQYGTTPRARVHPLELQQQSAPIGEGNKDKSIWDRIVDAAALTPRARGGMVEPGETTLVGEEGPELVRLPPGSEVFPTGTEPDTTTNRPWVLSQVDSVETKAQDARLRDFGDITTMRDKDSKESSWLHDLASDSRQYMAQLYSLTEAGLEMRTGSGVVVDQSGIVATNRHVAEDDAGNVQSLFARIGSGGSFPLEHMSSHEDRDIALFRLPAGVYDAMPMADSSESHGDVASLGYSYGTDARHKEKNFDLMASAGEQVGLSWSDLSFRKAVLNRMPWSRPSKKGVEESTSLISPGMSGGATVNREGELVGLNVSASSKKHYEGEWYHIAESMNYVPIEALKELLDSVPRRRGGKVGAGETSLVGEEGPELVQLPGGSEVFPSGTSPLPDLVKFERQWGDMDRITRIGYHDMHDAQIKFLTGTQGQWLSFWRGMDQSAYEGWSAQRRVADEEGPTIVEKVSTFFTDLFGGLEIPEIKWPSLPEWLTDGLSIDFPEIKWPTLVNWLTPSWVPWSPDKSYAFPSIDWPALANWLTPSWAPWSDDKTYSFPTIDWPALADWLTPSWAPWAGEDGWSFPTIEWPSLPDWLTDPVGTIGNVLGDLWGAKGNDVGMFDRLNPEEDLEAGDQQPVDRSGMVGGFWTAMEQMAAAKDWLIEQLWGEDSKFRKLFSEWIPGLFTGETWVEMYENMKVPFTDMMDWFTDTWSTVQEKITGPVGAGVDWVQGKMSGAVDKINNWIESYNDFSVTIPGFDFTASLPPLSVSMGPFGTATFGGWERNFQVWAEKNIELPDLPKMGNPFSGGYGDFSELDVPGAYMGGMIKTSGVTMVGERGAELVDFPAGARVSPLPSLNQSGGESNVVYVEVPVYIGTRQIKREVIEVMNGTVRERASRLT